VSAGGEPRAPGPVVAVTAIAVNTFREAIRDRILYLLLFFSLLLIAGSRFLSFITVGDEEKIVKDLGLSAIAVFGILTSVFVGASLVFKEIEKKTLYPLLASPVRRWHFVAGKYLGFMTVLAINVSLMTAALFFLLLARGEAPWGLVPAVVLTLVQLALVTAFAILFSSLTNPVLSAVGTLSVYVVGHLSWSFDLLRGRLPPGLARRLCDVVHSLLPSLDRLDVKMQVVHGLPLPHGYLLLGIGYGVCYSLVVLVLACLIFERRDFV